MNWTGFPSVWWFDEVKNERVETWLSDISED